MGGTALIVLTPYTAERVEPVVVVEMMAGGMERDPVRPGDWFSAEGLPYSYSLDPPDYETDTAELEIIERVAGRTMRCAVGLHIFVSNLAGRPVLGRLAQRVAERTEGWVLVEFQAPPAADLLDRLENAGRCVRVDDYVYLDAPAMAAWYAHPDFHVLK
ncbi:hypothetical protein F4560_003007 [Saccharothrix ecbatanensis]|uniref:Uncharacterized protein n=1 Tax=Saccharothrix ecbatanensis TaxID=1105145 RepID=A0A7W9HJ42_9PSEU|nr:hypothetical protein [Saccharothrix ecbatanensis]MBB5803239.1 hypothetical protein [Saccharothrix ecbatanensis]